MVVPLKANPKDDRRRDIESQQNFGCLATSSKSVKFATIRLIRDLDSQGAQLAEFQARNHGGQLGFLAFEAVAVQVF